MDGGIRFSNLCKISLLYTRGLRRLVRVVGKRRGEHARLWRGHVRLYAAVRPARDVSPEADNKYLLKGSTILIVALGLILMTKSIRLLA